MASVLFFLRNMVQFQLVSMYYRWKMTPRVKPGMTGVEPELPGNKPVVRRQLRPPTLNMTLVAPIMETPNLSPHSIQNDSDT